MFQLTKIQQRNVLGGEEYAATLASATADCGGGKTVSCSGSTCKSTDGPNGYCSCDSVYGELKFC